MSVIVIQFVTLDGIVTDPDGSDGTPSGGWAFRHGPEAVAGDKFRVGDIMDHGVLLLGRKTWELFSRIWPGRDDPFSRRMNAIPKLVASSTLTDTSVFPNSQVIDGDVADAVKRERRDVIVAGPLQTLGASGKPPGWVLRSGKQHLGTHPSGVRRRDAGRSGRRWWAGASGRR
jgi:dihydrofolate reductase